MTLVYVGEAFVPAPIQEPEKIDVAGVAFLYQGKGFAPGIPARHLTEEEADEIGRKRIRRLHDPHTGVAMYLEIIRDA